jgi:CubicO group peptidase (beta-lactamase class C family)
MKIPRKNIIRIAFALLCSSTVVHAQLSVDSLQYIIQREVNGRRSVGITAGLIAKDKKNVVSAGIIGESNKDLPNGNTIYEIGSITKVFTAILLADLVVKKQVRLNDPISRFLPAGVKAPTRNGKEITLEDLVTHTSGLPNLPANLVQKDLPNPFASYTVKEMYDFLSAFTPSRDIGSKYEYSNYGAALLGNILTKVTGSDYETMVKERICVPLKMKNTTVGITKKQRNNLASGYDRFGKPVVSYRDFDAFVAAAAIRSTVNDLLLFAAANLGLVKTKLDEAIKLSHRIQDTTSMPDIGIALGWHSFNRYGKQILWHNGATGGFKSFIGLDKESKKAIVVLTNGGNPVDDLSLHALNRNYKLQTFKYPWLLKDSIFSAVEAKASMLLFRFTRT